MSPRANHPESAAPLLEATAGIELQRQRVASWVQDTLRPVAKIIESEAPEGIDEEIAEEATHFEVREYQLDAWASLWEARQAGAKSGLIHLATGLGKTSVGVFDVIKFREDFEQLHGRQPRVLFTCHKNEILEQAAERFQAFIPDASQGYFNGDTKIRDADVTFATLQSLYEHLGSFKRNAYDYIIYDEAHHSQADTFSAVVKHFRSKFKLALTATPDRMDQQDIRDLFGNELYSKGLAEALAEGWLAEPDYHIVFDDAVKEAMQSGFETNSLRALAELFDVRPRNEIIAKNIKEEMRQIGLEFGAVKTIVFCQNIEHAEEMAELLGGEAYHSEAPKDARKKTLHDFRHSKLQVITTRDMFNEGIDIPDARLLVFLRSTSSRTVFEQQLGRGLRKHASKDRVSVLDFVANVERIAMIQDLANAVRNAGNGHSGGTHSGGNSDGGEIACGPGILGGDDNTTGINIHTNHADFDFDRLSIDLLEKFKSLVGRNEIFSDLNKSDLITLALTLSPDQPLTLNAIKALSAKRLFPSQTIVFGLFGSVRELQKACGFEVRELAKLTNEEIVELALELSPTSPLSRSAIAQLSKDAKFVSPSNIAKRFGGFADFQKACGLSPLREKTMDADLAKASTDDLVALANTLSPDKPLSAAAIRRLNKEGKFPSVGSIQNRFGSLTDFQTACGHEIEKPSTLTPQDIIAKARELSPDEPLNTTQIKALSAEGKFFGLTTIKRHFGSIQNFYLAAWTADIDTSRYLRNR